MLYHIIKFYSAGTHTCLREIQDNYHSNNLYFAYINGRDHISTSLFLIVNALMRWYGRHSTRVLFVVKRILFSIVFLSSDFNFARQSANITQFLVHSLGGDASRRTYKHEFY
jgi:hypothetical protein